MARPPTDAQFTEFVEARWPSLYRTAYLLVGDHGLAEDLVQLALAKTFASWGRVRAVEAAEPYTRSCLVNAAMSLFRKKAWWAERSGKEVPDPRPGRLGTAGHRAALAA